MPLIAEVFPVEKDDFVSAGEVSAKIKRTLKKLGVDSSVLRRISVCSYEVELHLVIHSLGGTIERWDISMRIRIILKMCSAPPGPLA